LLTELDELEHQINNQRAPTSFTDGENGWKIAA
jgi:hypothetical protein